MLGHAKERAMVFLFYFNRNREGHSEQKVQKTVIYVYL
jgi:hypothetical protein